MYVHVAKDTCFGKAVVYREHLFSEPTADAGGRCAACAELAVNGDEIVIIVVNVSLAYAVSSCGHICGSFSSAYGRLTALTL